MTSNQILEILPFSKKRIALFIDPLNNAMMEFDINTPLRKSAFIAQIGHESGSFIYVREIGSGSQYEGRKDLGNTQKGDGARYKGRGLIQITGRFNYEQCSKALKIDCINRPEILESPINATRSAAWFWKKNGLNELADNEDFLKITKRINGGTNGMAERAALYERAKLVLA